MLITRRQGLGLLAGAAATLSMPAIARAQAPKTVIGVQNGLPYLNFVVAEQLGLFEKHAETLGAKSEFEITRLGGPTALTEAILSGNVNIAALGMQPLLIGWEKTLSNYKMGGISAYWKGTYTIYANDPAIKSIADIRPTDKIAVPGPTSSQAVILRRAAEKVFGPGNAKKFDEQLVTLPHPDAVAALSTGNTVQVYFATSPFAEVLARAPNVHVIGTSVDYNPKDMTNGVTAGLSSFVTENPLVIKAFLAALEEANSFIRQDIEKTAEIYFAAEPSKVSDDQKIEIIRNNANEYTTVPNGVVETASFISALGQLKTVPAKWQDVFFAPINEGEGS
ncbi:ABC transporter substrate-binding protein [Mesorhizobium sp. DCY119]|uniref:ABC transporter substrate-binding protein n=1 Tax=Mesorhizobium sp. DCY119 TaxID=2108445 RepID=UPI000E74D679|nr:ABC transporter substrate-binding protein [Mesorhizobium sp. DCY119]RJG40523.1 ABC transporter substrate-binding protein [Mesorhizobium sp. DCY119]